MKYPYERFLRFLVSRRLSVTETLARYGLPRPGDLWLARCRSEFRQTAPNAIARYIDDPDVGLDLRDGILEWATTEGFLPLWEMQKEFGSKSSPELDIAFKVFVNPYSRAVLGMLLLSKITETELLAIMLEQFDLVLTGAAIALYRQIFWNIAGVDRKQWQVLVPTFESDEERTFIAFGLQSPTANEVRELLGMDCLVSDHKHILNQIIARSYGQYKKAMDGPNPEDAGAMRWAELAIRAITTAKTAGVIGIPQDEGPKTSAERFKSLFAVQPTKSAHPTLADLAGEVGKRVEKTPEKIKAGK